MFVREATGQRSGVCQWVSPKMGANALAIHCVHNINLEQIRMRTYLQRTNMIHCVHTTHTDLHTHNCTQTLVTGRSSRYLKAEAPAHCMAHAMRT
jgi:hypothetical protein